MLPLNANYFNEHLKELTETNMILYSGQPYGDVPYYPMCYVLSHSSNFKKYLNIENMSFEEYCKMLFSIYGEKWNVDENFMYDRLQLFKENLIIKTRDFSRRIDRGKWVYDINKLNSGFYIDSHLLRPYQKNKKEIEKLLK